MDFAKYIIIAMLVIAASIYALMGCGKGYDDGYRSGLRAGAEMFGAEMFDLDEWVKQHGGGNISYLPEDSETGRHATVTWRKRDYEIRIELTNGRVEIYHIAPTFLTFGEMVSLMESWNHPDLKGQMVFIPGGEGYAISSEVIDEIERANQRVDQLLQAE